MPEFSFVHTGSKDYCWKLRLWATCPHYCLRSPAAVAAAPSVLPWADGPAQLTELWLCHVGGSWDPSHACQDVRCACQMRLTQDPSPYGLSLSLWSLLARRKLVVVGEMAYAGSTLDPLISTTYVKPFSVSILLHICIALRCIACATLHASWHICGFNGLFIHDPVIPSNVRTVRISKTGIAFVFHYLAPQNGENCNCCHKGL